MLLRMFDFPRFTWIAASLLPIGAVAYIFKFYRKDFGALVLWKWTAVLVLFQIVLFVLSFEFVPRVAFLINVGALPVGYRFLEKILKKVQITSSLKESDSRIK
jgi:hypothetical protein